MNRSMRIAGLVCVLLLMELSVVAQAADQPSAVFSETTFDFGEVFEQKEYRHVFTVKNVGKADLVIEDVHPG
jgi:Protein of unknown function (DUF1573)